jgi:uncharacterized protein
VVNFYKVLRRSPFEPLKDLISKIAVCVSHLDPMLTAWFAEDFAAVKENFKAITVAEHEADLIKHEIRDHMPRSLLLPIDRMHFLEITSTADKIADRCEDIGYMLTIRHTILHDDLKPYFRELLVKCEECYAQMVEAVSHLDQLLDAGFSGPGADEVMALLNQVGQLEWETDKIKYKLAQHLFELESEINPVDLIMIHNLALQLGQFADSVEAFAKQLRRTLAH